LSPLGALLWARWRGLRHAVASLGSQSRLKVAVVSVSTVFLWLGAYGVSHRLFGLLQEFGAEWLGVGRRTLAELVMGQLLSTFALVLFGLLVLSNVVVTWGTLYRSQEMTLLMLSPAGWRTLFLGRFWECVTLSSWASAFLGSAVLLAYGRVVEAAPAFYLALLLVFPPFVLLPAALGAVLAMAGARVLPRLPKGLVLLGAAVLTVASSFGLRSLLAWVDARGAEAVRGVLQGSGAEWLPSQWAATVVLAAAEGTGFSDLWWPTSWLWLSALLAVVLATEVAARWLYPGWTDLRGRRWLPPGQRLSKARPSDLRRSSSRGRGRSWGWQWLPEPYRSLTAKDLRSFLRDPGQWSQFVVFFGIMALYGANMRPAMPSYQRELWQGWISVLNATVVLLVLATLTTRFIFPLISLEGRRLWIVGLTSATRKQLLVQKLGLSLVATALFTLPLAALSGWRLGLDGVELAFTLYAVASTSVALSGLAVGLGALLPDFSHDNPSRIVSGLGGTLNFILSIVFVALAGGAQALVLHWPSLAPWMAERWSLEAGRAGAVAVAVAILALASAVCCWVPMRRGLRNLRAVEL
jgi:ABC-2 type transport system permease protein